MTNSENRSGGPSHKAVEAGSQPLRAFVDRRDTRPLAVRVLEEAHDPALGMDRSVCLRDAVSRIRAEAAEVAGDDDYFAGLDAAAAILEREFGGGR